MTALVTYRGVVKEGKVQLKDIILPDGTEVVIVANQPVSINEWRKPFEEYFALADAFPGEQDINELSDEELVELVKEAREGK
jgi:hypothetical protein